MNNKEYKIIRLIILIIIIIYLIYKSGFVNNTKKVSANVSMNNTTTVKHQVVNGNLNVYFIDVGQADSILVTDGINNMLVDAGNNEDGPKLVNYIKSLGINSFKYVVGTHPHEDHIGGMDDIINNFGVDNYYMPDKLSTSKTFEDVLDALLNKNMKYTVPKISDELNFGDTIIKVIYIDSESNDANDSSIVLKIVHGNNSFLLTGDASKSVEKKVLNSDISSDVLKLGHHGSEYSTSEVFIDKVNPKYAVIEVGKNNIYNHPKDIILQRLDKRNIKVYRTDIDGTIIFTTDGNNININKEVTDTNG